MAGRCEALDGLPGGRGMSIAHEAIDRHVAHRRGDHVALRCLSKNGQSREYTFAHLLELTNRFANGLRQLELRPGARVYVLAGRIPELYMTVDGGKVQNVSEPGAEGELALRIGWPSMFRGYLHEEERYRKCFADGWYLTGDLATCDAGGGRRMSSSGSGMVKLLEQMVRIRRFEEKCAELYSAGRSPGRSFADSVRSPAARSRSV
ncbi:MAG: AMP-binding protein [Burkholderiales bacterium]